MELDSSAAEAVESDLNIVTPVREIRMVSHTFIVTVAGKLVRLV